MAYTLTYSGNQTGGNRQIEVPDGSVASVGNVTLPGRNFNGYGSPVDQNILSMVENWASSATGPSLPVTGQLWYDAAQGELKYNISTVPTASWVSVPQVDANGNATFGNVTFTGNLTVAPPGVITGNGSGLSSLNASNLSTGTIPAARLSGTYNIDINGNVSGTTVVATGNITGGNIITAGFVQAGGNITGANLVTGGTVSATGNVTGGNITTAGSVVATGSVSGGNITAGNLVVTNSSTLGSNANVIITGGSAGQFLSTNGSGSLSWTTPGAAALANGTSSVTIPVVNGNVNTSVGGSANMFVVTSTGANINGTLDTVGNFTTTGSVTATGNVAGGNLTTAGRMTATGNVAGGNLTTAGVVTATGTITGGNISTAGTVSATGNISGGNITTGGSVRTPALTTGAVGTAGTITGAWTLVGSSTLEATYADLAERHHADKAYPVGTVMTVGGVNEVTSASVGSKVLGVVSNAYAYLMNSTVGNDETHPPVAYVGRVPVRVTGPINKHDVIVATLDGCARAGFATEGFGWALETNTDEGEKLVLCIIK